jgi:hypothetical protein
VLRKPDECGQVHIRPACTTWSEAYGNAWNQGRDPRPLVLLRLITHDDS